MSARTCLLPALMVLSLPQLAGAKEPVASSTAFELDGHVGAVHGEHSGGFSLAASGRVRYAFLTGGVGLQGSTIVLNSMGAAALLAGLSVPFAWMRIDALGELGVDLYARAGSNFLNGNPGTSAALPFAGGRVSILGRIRQGPNGRDAWLGLSANYAADLCTETKTYGYTSRGGGWFGNDTGDDRRTASVRIGQSRVGVFATAGVTLPL